MFLQKYTFKAFLFSTLLFSPLTSQADLFGDLLDSVSDSVGEGIGGIVDDNITDVGKGIFGTDDDSAEEKSEEKTNTTSAKAKQTKIVQAQTANSDGEIPIEDLPISAESKLFMKDLQKAMPKEENVSFSELKKKYNKQWKAFLTKQNQPKNAPYECLMWATNVGMMEAMLAGQNFKQLMAERNTAKGVMLESMFYEDHPAGSSGEKLTTQLIKQATQGVKAKQLSQKALKACSADKSLQIQAGPIMSEKQEECESNWTSGVYVTRMLLERETKKLGSKQQAVEKLEREWNQMAKEDNDTEAKIQASLFRPAADGATDKELTAKAIKQCMAL